MPAVLVATLGAMGTTRRDPRGVLHVSASPPSETEPPRRGGHDVQFLYFIMLVVYAFAKVDPRSSS